MIEGMNKGFTGLYKALITGCTKPYRLNRKLFNTEPFSVGWIGSRTCNSNNIGCYVIIHRIHEYPWVTWTWMWMWMLWIGYVRIIQSESNPYGDLTRREFGDDFWVCNYLTCIIRIYIGAQHWLLPPVSCSHLIFMRSNVCAASFSDAKDGPHGVVLEQEGQLDWC
jgi:hypothetical protein